MSRWQRYTDWRGRDNTPWQNVAMSTNWAEQIGQEIKRQRTRARLKFNSLSDRTRDIKRPVHRVAIPKLESGERDITVGELFGLAGALGLPPLALLFPDIREDVELFPGNVVAGVDALGWFTGTGDHVGQDASAIGLALALVTNEVALKAQHHNLFQGERGLELEEAGSLSMVAGMREQEEKNVKQTRERIKFLESRREELLNKGCCTRCN